MEQLNENEIKERTCILCKQTSIETNSLEDNNSNNNKKKQKCSECKKIIMGDNWCQTCNSMKFQQNFKNWTSGNDIINKLIQNSQLSAKNHFQLLEWIPYEKFRNISYATEGKFGKVYSANWKDGYITYWNKKKNQWKRDGKTTVALKTLNNSQNITLEFINQVMLHLKIQEYKLSDQIIKCHGITRDPKTKDYIIVMNYIKIGNLPNFMTKKKKKLYKQHKLHENNLNLSLQLWRYKIMILQRISAGLKRTHSRKLILRDFHIEDIVCNNCITDMRLCKPENHKKFENVENNMYDILLNLAPEILRGQECTQYSEIYSFGITMFEMISELSLYNNNNVHGLCLVLNICEELKPEINIKVPQLMLNLIKKCLDVNPLDRPNANDLLNFFDKWLKELNRYIKGIENQAEATKTELIKQIEEIEKVENINENPSPDDDDSPLPKNHGDYYENYNNISDEDYSENSSNSEDNDFEECAIHD